MSSNTLTTADGLFKTVYGENITDLTPDGKYLAKEIPAGRGSATGGDYKRPQVLTSEQGFTKSAPNSTAYALNSPSSGAIQYATYAPYQFSLRVAYSTEAIKRSSEGKDVFAALTKQQTKNALKTSYNEMEDDILYGQSGLGIVASISSNTITLTAASFASGHYWGSEGKKVWIYSTAFGALRGTAKITTYNIASGTRTITLDSAPAGIVATDIICTSVPTDQMIGFNKIFTNTTGSLFGINSSTYNLWRPAAAVDIAGAISFNKLFAAVTVGFNRGLGDDIAEFDVLLNPRAWNNLNQDAAAVRKTDYSYKSNKFEDGHEVLEFYTNAGVARIIAHKCVKEGDGFILPRASRSFEKLGAAITPVFGIDDSETRYLRRMENNEGYESRVYWNCAIATDYISQCVKMDGIVNA